MFLPILLVFIIRTASIVVSASPGANGPPIFIDEGGQPGDGSCIDNDLKCSVWASQGECQSNAAWMMGNCRRSCQSCQGGDRAWKLRTHIASNYDNSTAANNFSINSVFIESVRIDHLEIDETRQIIQSHGRLVLTWNDTRIMWDPDQWGISWLNFYWIQIWTPQIVQTNAPTTQPGTISGKILAANHTGQVFMWTDFSFTSACSFDYADYPNDRHRCCFKFDDKRYFAVRFKVADAMRRLHRQELTATHLSGWQVDAVDVNDEQYVVQVLSDWRHDPYDLASSNCEICVTVQRNAGFYSSHMLLPTLTTSMITICSLLITNGNMQLWMLIASIALQLATLALITMHLPMAALGIPTILKYASFNLASTSISFLILVILHRLIDSQSSLPPPHIIDQIISIIDRFIPLLHFSSFTSTSKSDIDQSSTSTAAWMPLAIVVKSLLFYSFLLLYPVVAFFAFFV